MDILLREKQQLNDDECVITDVFVNKPMKHHDNIVELSSSDDDDGQDVLPLPLWDRIRQRRVV